MTYEDLREWISKTIGLREINPRLIADAAQELVSSSKMVETAPGRFVMTREAKAEYTHQVQHQKRLDATLVSALWRQIENDLNQSLDKNHRDAIAIAFQKALTALYDYLAENAEDYLEGQALANRVPRLASLVREELQKYSDHTLEFISKIRPVCEFSLEKVFYDPEPDFSEALLANSTKHVMLRIIRKTPDFERYGKSLFSGASIVVDTNVLISIGCESSRRHDHSQWLIEATRSLGVEIIVADVTLTEFGNAIDHATYLYKENRGRNISNRVLENEIVRTYYDSKDFYKSWDDFSKSLRAWLDLFLKTYDVQVRKTDDYGLDTAAVRRAAQLIADGMSPKVGRVRSLERHDATCILFIQEERRRNPGRPFNSPWFLTHHRSLIEADSVLCREMEFARNAALMAESWFELIYPFLWSTTDEDEASDVFTRMISNSLLPIPTPQAKSFVRYVAEEFELSRQDEQLVLKIVHDRHRKRALEKTLRYKGAPAAIEQIRDELREGLATMKKVEEKNSTIERLVRTITERGAAVSVDLDASKLKELCASARAARTNTEKGETLEKLAQFVVKSITGFKIIEANLRLAAEEIDILAANQGGPMWGDPILVECKNWNSRVGASDISVFIDKLETQRSTTGLLFAKNGVTGTDFRDVAAKVREALSRKGIRILVLSLADLESCAIGEDLARLLERRWYTPEKIEHLAN